MRFDMWYVYGDAVLDRLLGTNRAREISVYSDTLMLSPSEVRTVLGVGPKPPVYITNDPPTPITNLDRYALLPTGEITELGSETQGPPPLPLRLYIQLSDWRRNDVVRLTQLMRDYPEILVGEADAEQLAQHIAELRSRRQAADEIDLPSNCENFDREWNGPVYGG